MLLISIYNSKLKVNKQKFKLFKCNAKYRIKLLGKHFTRHNSKITWPAGEDVTNTSIWRVSTCLSQSNFLDFNIISMFIGLNEHLK